MAGMGTHDPDFYLEDGNIVLGAKDSQQNTIYFRLHKSVLIIQSPIFNDLFSLPSPENMDQYDGAPYVEMAGDDAQEMHDFVAFFYNPQIVAAMFDEGGLALRLLGPIKLAKKYEVDWIWKSVATQLQQLWPSTLAGWCSLNEDESQEFARGEVSEAWQPDWDDNTLRLRNFPEPVSSILMARECGASSILPFAFLHLLRCHPESITSEYFHNVPQRALLPPDDSRRLLIARERIGRWITRFDYAGMQSWNACASDRPCETTVLRTRLRFIAGVARDGHVMESSMWTQYPNGLWEEHICPGCKGTLEEEIGKLQQAFVDKLATFFQLNE
ncbi:hypothetical protein C8R47DRAFT_285508 [Mycena vitilis]|nr:hypothetical protein C8R47DRAFT_285508 [Mycena vitilis]